MAADQAPEDERPGWTWTPRQRRVIAVLLLVAAPVVALRLACDRAYVPDPPPARGPRYDEVADRIDPNTADLADLSALPTVGEKRAQDVIDYRERRRAGDPTRPVFTRPEDLLPIKGFGRATVETLRPYLMFPQAPATTRGAAE